MLQEGYAGLIFTGMDGTSGRVCRAYWKVWTILQEGYAELIEQGWTILQEGYAGLIFIGMDDYTKS